MAGFIFLIVCLVGKIAYDIIKYGELGWELGVFIVTCLIIVIANRVQGDVEIPKDMFNRPLPLGNSKQDKNRRKLCYCIESLIWSAGFAVIDIVLGSDIYDDLEMIRSAFPSLGKTECIIISALISFVVAFAVSMLIEYISGERKVRKYNAMLAKLDSDDDE